MPYLINLLTVNNFNRIKLELCAYSIEACRTAAAKRLESVELSASPADGGITPSLAVIEQVAGIEGLGASVMIRPRGGDFLYNDEEVATMLRDIELARRAGASGVVFGILTADGRVDIERTKMLVEAAQGMETTFHREIDMTEDYLRSVEDVITTGCKRILTSGSYDKAIDGIDNNAHAETVAAGRIEIMAGSGVTPANVKQLAEVGVDALHFSAKRMVAGGMKYRNPRISMGGSSAVDEYALRAVNEAEIDEIVTIIKG